MDHFSKLYLIPTFLNEESLDVLSPYVTAAIKECEVFFVENKRSARRFAKSLWKEMPVDNIQWFEIEGDMEKLKTTLFSLLKQGRTMGILSEAGCPGVADPGQELVRFAQEANAKVIPLVGPSSILLALMASGMNGQDFHFSGYLPIDKHLRAKKIRELEFESRKKGTTEIFIETPYRNNQLLDALLKTCEPGTRLCIAVDITGKNETIYTKTVAKWKTQVPDINKRPAIFLIHAS